MPSPLPALAAVLAQAEPATDEPEMGAVGRWVYDRTDSEAWADVATWVVDIPLRLLLIWGTAWLVSRILRRLIRRFSCCGWPLRGSVHVNSASATSSTSPGFSQTS